MLSAYPDVVAIRTRSFKSHKRKELIGNIATLMQCILTMVYQKLLSLDQQFYLSSLTQHPAKPIEVFVGCVQFLELSVTSIKNCEQ